MHEILKGKKILVTGGTGSIGSEIVRRALDSSPAVVRIFSNDENGVFDMQQAISLHGHENVRFLIGDVRDKDRLRMGMDGIDIVYHAAALKHVPLCEYNPFDAVKTNVLGTQNVVEAALDAGVDRLVSISTDKAVNPVNTMGATKLLSEKLVTDANFYKGSKKTVFSCVRFGNVVPSRGSVVPLFRSQIERGGPVTVTMRDMTRFMMTISAAVELVFRATKLAHGGETFIFKMPVVKVQDLVEVMISELASGSGFSPSEVRTEVMGPRPGEKQFEELMTEIEAKRALETKDMFIIPPEVDIPMLRRTGHEYERAKPTGYQDYTSRNAELMSKEDIKRLLQETDML